MLHGRPSVRSASVERSSLGAVIARRRIRDLERGRSGAMGAKHGNVARGSIRRLAVAGWLRAFLLAALAAPAVGVRPRYLNHPTLSPFYYMCRALFPWSCSVPLGGRAGTAPGGCARILAQPMHKDLGFTRMDRLFSLAASHLCVLLISSTWLESLRLPAVGRLEGCTRQRFPQQRSTGRGGLM